MNTNPLSAREYALLRAAFTERGVHMQSDCQPEAGELIALWMCGYLTHTLAELGAARESRYQITADGLQACRAYWSASHRGVTWPRKVGVDYSQRIYEANKESEVADGK